RPDAQRQILDAYAGETERATAVREAHGALARQRGKLEGLEVRRREIEQRADFLRFQLQEIEAAEVDVAEEPSLAEAALRLEHAEELARLAGSLHVGLYDGENAVTAALGGLRRALDRLIAIDPSQEPARELLETAYYNAEELGRVMGDYAAAVEHDP